MDYSENAQYGQSVQQRVSTAMRGVYLKMFLGLIVTAAVSWWVASAGAGFVYYLAQHQWVYWGLAIVEIGLVLGISAGLRKLSSATATFLFFLFAVVNGLTLSMIFMVYTLVSIFKTFLITAGVFGAMSVYGFFTTQDLTRIGSFLMMALWGLIILCVVNIFWANSTLEWIVSGLGVLIFIGLTAWDTQWIKRVAYQDPTMDAGRLSTLGALTLYLDFVNMFIYLLRFFGATRD